MLKILYIIIIILFTQSCEDNYIYNYEEEESFLDIYSTSYKDENGYYHYPFNTDYYGSIYFQTDPLVLVSWTSPDEYCIEHFNYSICEEVVSGQTYAREDGTGQQNFYILPESIGDTLTLIGYLPDNGNVQDMIKLIIEVIGD